MVKTPQVGEQAPDFELPGTAGPFRLSDHRGECVVLLFYPGDHGNTTPAVTIDGAADWDKLTVEERRALIRATVKRAAINQGRGPARVAVELFS
jgi:hypothetical protein